MLTNRSIRHVAMPVINRLVHELQAKHVLDAIRDDETLLFQDLDGLSALTSTELQLALDYLIATGVIGRNLEEEYFLIGDLPTELTPIENHDHVIHSMLDFIPANTSFLQNWTQSLSKTCLDKKLTQVVAVLRHADVEHFKNCYLALYVKASHKPILIFVDDNVTANHDDQFATVLNLAQLKRTDLASLLSDDVLYINYNAQLSDKADQRLWEVLTGLPIKIMATLDCIAQLETLSLPNIYLRAVLLGKQQQLHCTPHQSLLEQSRKQFIPTSKQAIFCHHEEALQFIAATYEKVDYTIELLPCDDINKHLLAEHQHVSVSEAKQLTRDFKSLQLRLRDGNSVHTLHSQRVKAPERIQTVKKHGYTNLNKLHGPYLHVIGSAHAKLLSFINLIAYCHRDILQTFTTSEASQLVIAPSAVPSATNTTAIVGYALRAPQAPDAESFWQQLVNGQSAITTYQLSDRVRVKGNIDSKTYHGGLLPYPIDHFDAEFFGIQPNEATYMDPQQRQLLETAWHAIEQAGLRPEQLQQTKTGIYIGVSNQDFGKLIARYDNTATYNRYVNAGSNNGTIAGRLAYFLKTDGPSIVVDTACASSLTALSLAKAAIQNGEVEIAIVGGANVILSAEFTAGDEAMGVISKSGTVNSFSSHADGYVRSEGVAVLILASERVAQQLQLTMHAMLRAVHVNQEVHAKHFSMPGEMSQSKAFQDALQAAHCTADDIDVLEAHATGTLGGDAIELAAIYRTFGQRTTAEPLLVGSCKPNIGHTEAPSGLIGVIKILMALKHGVIPGQINYQSPNTKIDHHPAAVQVVTANRQWLSSPERKRRAAVTSLSFAGTNVQVILEEAGPQPYKPSNTLRVFNHQSFWPEVLGGPSQPLLPTITPASNDDERELLSIFSRITGREVLDINASFFHCGGSSIKLNDLKHSIWQQFGADITLKDLFALDTVRRIVAALPATRHKPITQQITPNSPDAHLPFPLTSIQQAYYVGRELPAKQLGGVSTHLYYEVAVPHLELSHFENALNQLITRHPMLRAVMTANAQQQVLEQVPAYRIARHDLAQLSGSALTSAISQLRESRSHEKFHAQTWPLFRIEVIHTATSDLLLLSFDCLIIDMYSLHTLMREWYQLYHTARHDLAPLSLTFRDYVTRTTASNHELDNKAKQYWQARIPALPLAPELPMKNHPETLQSLTFKRVSTNIPADTWQAIKLKAAAQHVSPTSVLLTLFAAVIAKWSVNKRFLLNLTLFTREKVHPQVNEILGDFTLTELLAIQDERLSLQPLHAAIQAIHDQLWNDLEHNRFDGMAVIRELMRHHQTAEGEPIAPVVFTSLLNLDNQHDHKTWLDPNKITYGITQTPQLWLDHKTFEHQGQLVAEWDYVSDLFDEQIIKDMHDAYTKLVRHAAQHDWQQPLPSYLPDWQQDVLHFEPRTVFPRGDSRLHELFHDTWQQYATKTAVVSADRSLSYADVFHTAQWVANALNHVAHANELIAVLCPPGWRQVTACLGIQYAGAAYLPLDVKWPAEYISGILARTRAKAIISCRDHQDLLSDVTANHPAIKKILLDTVHTHTNQVINKPVKSSDLAYVIFTSGSTGAPKGVNITHGAVVNTVLDINQRYGVTSHDVVFAISKLSFDLSVYDIYGLLSVGGTIVYPHLSHDNDPEEWYRLCQQHQVTVWNSVPRIVEMMMNYLTQEPVLSAALPSLRVVMMSGDVIPVKLPSLIDRYCPNPALRKYSLGGATEGSIWSIDYEITTVADSWHSIPYGKALTNQTMMVLDPNLEPTPVGVLGDIAIGGVGVAQGYWEDTAKTQAAFKQRLEYGDRIYLTGDRGYKTADGNIIYCGRLDNQAKINGFRVELDGVRNILNELPITADSAVFPYKVEGNTQLIAFIKRPERADVQAWYASFESELKDEAAKATFKMTATNKFHDQLLSGATKVPLKLNRTDQLWYARKSYRQFSASPIDPVALLRLFKDDAVTPGQSTSLDEVLTSLSAITHDEHALPKYLYPSAGSAYPVKIYLRIGAGTHHAPGYYYYHASEHALYLLKKADPATIPAGISLMFVGHHALIKPMYGAKSTDFIAYEFGAMKLLCGAAIQQSRINLCGMQDDFRSALNLSTSETVLLTAEPEQTTLKKYLYVQRQSEALAAGLYEEVAGELRFISQCAPYPVALDHGGDNAAMVDDAAALILITTTASDLSTAFYQVGAESQQWMLNANQLGLGLCALGLPIMPEAISQALSGQLMMAYALGQVTPAQQASHTLSTVKENSLTLASYVKTQLEQRKNCPSYMIPSDCLAIQRIPLTGNGKVDRKSLLERYQAKRSHTAARAATLATTNHGNIQPILDLIINTLAHPIDPNKTFSENGIRSHNAFVLKSALQRVGFTLQISSILKNHSVGEFIRNNLSGVQPLVPLHHTPVVNEPLSVVSDTQHEPIAIIGMSCRFPGANNLNAYWQLLEEGTCGLTYYDAAHGSQTGLKSFGAIEGLLEFDHQFFGVPPKQAATMHPAQRVWLESVYHALEDAGYAGDRSEEIVGVYASAGGEPYQHSTYYDRDGLVVRTGNEIDYFAARSAYAFNFTGPVMTIQSACSSSLVSIHHAVRALRANDATMMVAGGIHTSRFNQEAQPDYPEGSIFSKQGVCQPFAATADGIVETQGVGTVVLKTLSKARRDGDRVYATILGSAMNNDGNHKRDFTSPNVDSQAAVIDASLRNAKIHPNSITAIEAHGTGTPIGDPIEFDALSKRYQYAAIGSVKGNIGHTVTAAGVAGVIKMALALYHRQLPGTLHATIVNPLLDFTDSKLYINQQTKSWDATAAAPRRGAVSSFGMGGTNAHAIMEEAEYPAPLTRHATPQIIVLSAKTPAALQAQRQQHHTFWQQHANTDLTDIAYTLAVGREHLPCRTAMIVHDHHALLSSLQVDAPAYTQRGWQLRWLTANDFQAFKNWYHDDPAYRRIVEQQLGVLHAVTGMTVAIDTLDFAGSDQPQQQAISLFLLTTALYRYAACHLPMDTWSPDALTQTIANVIKGERLFHEAIQSALTLSIPPSPVEQTYFQVANAKETWLMALAAYYVRGTTLQWREVWREQSCQKISAPLYPFAKTRFWQPATQPVAPQPEQRGLLASDPVLLPDGIVCYQTTLSLTTNGLQYLHDHRVFNAIVFPGAGYTELLLSAVLRLHPEAAVEISQINYKEALRLTAEPRICQVMLTPTQSEAGNTRYQVSILSFAPQDRAQTVLHAVGECLIKQSVLQRQPRIQLERMAQTYTQSITTTYLYQQLQRNGMQYAAAFRGVQSLQRTEQANKGFALCRIQGSDDGYTIHPALLDSSLQALAGILLPKDLDPAITYIPVSHGSCRYFRRPGQSAYVQLTAHQAHDAAYLQGDVAIYTEQGDLALLIRDVCLQPMPRAALKAKLGQAIETLSYQVEYETQALVSVNKDTPNVVAIGTAEQLALLPEATIKLTLNDIAQQAATVNRLMAIQGPLNIAYLGAMADTDTLHGLWTFVEFIQLLSRHNMAVGRMIIVTQQAFAAVPGDTVAGVNQGVYRGLTLSLAAAKPRWQVSILDIEHVDAHLPTVLSQEMNQANDAELIICYRKEQRHVARLTRQDMLFEKVIPDQYFHEQEACLITGGLGGLGLRLAEWLVTKGARHLVLLNRVKKAEPTIIQTWRAQDVTVHTTVADISDLAALRQVFAAIRNDKQQLVGIFHLAGILRDKLLEQMTRDDFEQVFAAKVNGTHHLHELSLEEPALRYFVLFSSLVSLVGSPAQLNYAAANSYLDSLSEQRAAQGLPVQRINFGAFAEVGMASTLTTMLQQRGHGQITPAEGLQALGAAMTMHHSHGLFARVDIERLWRGRQPSGYLQRLSINTVNTVESTLAKSCLLANEAERTQQLTAHVQQCVARELGVSADQVETTIGFQHLLHDSIVLSQLGETLKADLRELTNMQTQWLWDYPTIERLVAHLNQQIQLHPMVAANSDIAAKDAWRRKLPNELRVVYFGNAELTGKYITSQKINDLCDEGGRRALYIAICQQHVALVDSLLKLGADPHLTTQRGISAFDAADAVNHQEINLLIQMYRSQRLTK